MKIAEKIINEAEKDAELRQKLNTRIRKQVETYGTRAARIMVQESIKVLANVLDPKHNSPNPMTQADAVYLKEAVHIGNEMIKKIKIIKESKKKTR